MEILTKNQLGRFFWDTVYNIIGFLGELLCFWLRSSSILHVKLILSGAAPELLRKSGAKGVSTEGKFG